MLFASQVPALQVCSGHGPQLIVEPHPVGTSPQAPAGQVVIGWQQLFWKQTWVPVQQTPLQQPGAGQPVPGPFSALAVPQVLPLQVATLQVGGVGQFAGVRHWTHVPLEQTPLPPACRGQTVPSGWLAVPHWPATHVAILQTGGCGQVSGVTQPTHTPSWHCRGAAQLLPGWPLELLTRVHLPPWQDCTLQTASGGTAGQVPASLPQHSWQVPLPLLTQHVWPWGQVAWPLVQHWALGIHAAPHCLYPWLQVQAVPLPLHVEFCGHVPQDPPQPSEPQTLPVQFGLHEQTP